MASKQEIGEQNVLFLRSYIERKKASGESFPMRNGKLYMTGIYREMSKNEKASRAPSWFNTSADAGRLLDELRNELATDGLLSNSFVVNGKSEKLVKKLESRVMQLENRIAALAAENQSLKGELERKALAEAHLISTGRTLR